VELRLCCDSLLQQTFAESGDRVTLLPQFHLRRTAVLGRLGHGMTAKTVGDRLDEIGAGGLAHPFGGILHRLIDGHGIAAVYLLRWDVVTAGAAVNFREGRGPSHPGADPVEVILADEQHRQIPKARPVQPLMESSLVYRPVAEETGADPVLLPEFGGE